MLPSQRSTLNCSINKCNKYRAKLNKQNEPYVSVILNIELFEKMVYVQALNIVHDKVGEGIGLKNKRLKCII